MPLYATPSKNAVQKTLGAQLLAGVTAAANLSDVVGLQNLPGIMVIDRVDTNNDDTPTKREYITYTGVSGSTVTGLTRNVDSGSTDQDHAIGAIVEFVPDVTWAGSMYAALSALVDTSTLVADPLKIIVPSGLSAQLASQATYVNMHVYNSLEASGASLSGINILVPTWFIPGYSSAPTVSVGSPVDMPISGTIEFASARLRTAISGASLVLDILKNGTSIFATETRLSILGSGLYASTASISDKTFVAGDYFSVDIDNGGWFGDLTIKFKAR
jgi:hypothetical protein